jgi:DNA polymerase-3 subunit beta
VKFIVGREALGDAVAFVARALPSRPVVPQLSAMLIQAGPDGLSLSCFDYEVSARALVDAEVSEPGMALVPGRLLAEITRSLPRLDASFSADGEMVTLVCGHAEFGLVCLSAAEYPALPESPAPVGTVDGGVLSAAISQVAPAAARDDAVPMLTAVCLDVNGGVLTLAATDRYRLAARDVAFQPAETGLRALALVPARTVVEAARMLAAGVPATLAFAADTDPAGRASGQPRPAEGLVSVESRGKRLTARLIGGEYIRYRSRFPDVFDCSAELPADLMIEAVRRAALIAERAGPVRLSFQPDKVLIEAHAEGRARAAETVAASFAGEQPVISFSPHYLLDGLTAAAAGAAATDGARASGDAEEANAPRDPAEAREDGRIRLEFSSPAKPALITWVDAGSRPGDDGAGAAAAVDPAFRYLLVPQRVQPRG